MDCFSPAWQNCCMATLAMEGLRKGWRQKKGGLLVARASGTSKRRQPQASKQETAEVDAPERPTGWRAISELRWRPRTNQQVIFLSGWSRRAEHGDAPAVEGELNGADEEQAQQERAEAVRREDVLPPVD